jgi:hypothetical protein
MQSISQLSITKVCALIEAYEHALVTLRLTLVPLAVFLVICILDRLSDRISPLHPEHIRIAGELIALVVFTSVASTVHNLSNKMNLFIDGVLARATIYKITKENEESSEYWKMWLRAYHPKLGTEVTLSFQYDVDAALPCQYKTGQQFNVLMHSASSKGYWLDRDGPINYEPGDWRGERSKE